MRISTSDICWQSVIAGRADTVCLGSTITTIDFMKTPLHEHILLTLCALGWLAMLLTALYALGCITFCGHI